jgi:hypothetical protein
MMCVVKKGRKTIESRGERGEERSGESRRKKIYFLCAKIPAHIIMIIILSV